MQMRLAGKIRDVYLGDDGTMDTVVTIDGREFRFDCEYASSCRRSNGEMTLLGLRTLAKECEDDIDSDDQV